MPAFLLVGASGALLPRLRRSPAVRAVLDGVNAASLALMAVVTLELVRGGLSSPLRWLLAAVALILLRVGVNSAWLVAGGAFVGLLAG